MPVPVDRAGGARWEGRSECRNRRAIDIGGGALAFAGQAFLQRVHDQGAHETCVAEAHLGLGGMHIGVDLLRRERHEQGHHGMTITRQIVGIGRADGAQDQLVAYRTAIDEQILPERIGAGQRGRGGKASTATSSRSGADFDGAGAEIGAQDIAEPRQRPGAPGSAAAQVTGARFFAGKAEGNVGPRHARRAPLRGSLRLRCGRLEEFQPCRGGIKKVIHFDAGAVRQRGRRHRRFLAGIDRQRPGMRFAGMARGDAEPRDCADRRQGLAAEAERADAQQVFVIELGGGMPLHGEREIGSGHATAIVGDADPTPSAAIGEDVDPARAGIDGVLNQFLDDARGTLDYSPRRCG